MWPFSDFHYGFRSSRSIADLLTVVSDRIAGLLTGLGLYPGLLTEFDRLVFFTNLSLMDSQVRYLTLLLLFAVIDSFGWFWMGSH